MMAANIDSTASMMILEVIMIVTTIIATAFAVKMAKVFYFSDGKPAEKTETTGKKETKGLVAAPKLS
jgi:NADH:ubiquinone oxidoreductase subunit 2 (subunit N)